MIESLFLNIIEITISTSFIIVSLLIISPLLKKKYTAKWQYLIWLIIGVKLLIPFKLSLPEEFFKIPIPIFTETNEYKETELFEYPLAKANNQPDSDSLASITNENINLNIPLNETISDTPIKTLDANNLNITSLKFFSLCWLIGVVLFFTYQFLGYFTLKKKLLRWSNPVRDEEIYMCLKKTCKELQLSSSMKIMKCKTLSSPMVMGLLHPVILLPEKRIALESLSIILKHEVIHIKHHDILYKLLLTLANGLHWFNPIVYFMVKEANKDLEFYCDERVIKDMDIDYKSRYSDAILSVTHNKSNFNSILSTNFNGGVETMKERFKNIFDNNKKRFGILSLTLIFTLVLFSSTLIACQSSAKPPSKETSAKEFLKGYYEVNNILLLSELQALWEEGMSKAPDPKGGLGIKVMTEEGENIYYDAALKNIKSYITDSFGANLIANRTIERNLQEASDYGYTLSIPNIQLTSTDSNNSNKTSYDYSIEVKITYEDTTWQNQIIDGNISLTKEANRWLVNSLTETTPVVPDKKYYKSSAVVTEIEPDVSTNVSIEEFTTAKELCDGYIQGMLINDYSFISSHTLNSYGNTNNEEDEKIWTTIKIDSVEIIDFEERVNDKFPNMSKAYYELKINVSEPGNSSFEKGENIRWLYLSSSKKSSLTSGENHWVVEELSTSGKPDELWWNIINGG